MEFVRFKGIFVFRQCLVYDQSGSFVSQAAHVSHERLMYRMEPT